MMPNRIQSQPFQDTGQQICNSWPSVTTTRLVILLSTAGKIKSCDGKVLVHSEDRASTCAWFLLLKRAKILDRNTRANTCTLSVQETMAGYLSI